MPINLSSAQLTNVIPEFRDKSATYQRRIFGWTGPAAYVTGGEATDLTATFGLGRVPLVLATHAYNGTDLRLVRWNATTSKMQWFDLAGAEIANGVDLSAYSFNAEAIGK